MTEPISSDELARHIRHHLQSWQMAGLQWLPRPSASNPIAEKSAPTVSLRNRNMVNDLQSGSDHSEDLLAPITAMPELSMEDRVQSLELLAKEVKQCAKCPELCSTRTQTVFGEGPFDAEICFIGEGPGANEDKKGRPFVGEAGQLLDRIIQACGFQRNDVYICNIVKCRPPGNRTPQLTEASNCRVFLEKQLELIQPKYICALGACAAQNLLGRTESITRMRQRFHDYMGIPVICTYHPAYLLRTPAKKKEVWEDMKMLLRKMGREIPAEKKDS